jgi:hypothetical protein
MPEELIFNSYLVPWTQAIFPRMIGVASAIGENCLQVSAVFVFVACQGAQAGCRRGGFSVRTRNLTIEFFGWSDFQEADKVVICLGKGGARLPGIIALLCLSGAGVEGVRVLGLFLHIGRQVIIR